MTKGKGKEKKDWLDEKHKGQSGLFTFRNQRATNRQLLEVVLPILEKLSDEWYEQDWSKDHSFFPEEIAVFEAWFKERIKE